MTVYIALLRGINVGGKNKIKMAELKQMFESLGFKQVQTYIQSGNVLFESNETESALREKIEKEIKKEFGLTIPVVLRTADELNRIANNCPFTEEEIQLAKSTGEAESLYVAMLSEVPSQTGIEKLQKYSNEEEKYQIAGRDIYLLFHHSIRNSKLASSLDKIGVYVTVRNWNTINKLVELANSN